MEVLVLGTAGDFVFSGTCKDGGDEDHFAVYTVGKRSISLSAEVRWKGNGSMQVFLVSSADFATTTVAAPDDSATVQAPVTSYDYVTLNFGCPPGTVNDYEGHVIAIEGM